MSGERHHHLPTDAGGGNDAALCQRLGIISQVIALKQSANVGMTLEAPGHPLAHVNNIHHARVASKGARQAIKLPRNATRIIPRKRPSSLTTSSQCHQRLNHRQAYILVKKRPGIGRIEYQHNHLKIGRNCGKFFLWRSALVVNLLTLYRECI